VRKFLKTTIVGGAVFLLPLVIVVLLLSYALGFAAGLIQPVVDTLGVDLRGNFAGIGLLTIVATLVLIALCFGAGLIARTAFGDAVTTWIEASVLGRMPQYQMMKSMASAFGQLENAKGLTPVLVSVEGGWQIGYHLETLENGWQAVFLPQAPTPMSGNVMYFPSERVRATSMTMIDASRLVSRLGIGSRETFGQIDMTQPPGQ
jgi:uncharacterized membrane protein